MSDSKTQSVLTVQELFETITALDTVLVNRKKQNAIIERDYPNRHLTAESAATRRQRLDTVRQGFEKAWTSLLYRLDALCKQIRVVQPLLCDLQIAHINTALVYPKALAVNRMLLKYKNCTAPIPVPRLLPFPIPKSLIFTEGDKTLSCYHIMLRLLQTMPVGKLQITAIDPMNLGTSLAPFLPLLKVEQLFPEQRLLTYGDEIEKILAQLEQSVEARLQYTFQKGITDWSCYNEKHPDDPLPYHLLLLFGVPEQLSDKSLWYLGRLMEYGPKCGILPILTVDKKLLIARNNQRESDRKLQRLQQMIQQHGKKMNGIPALLQKHIQELSISAEQDTMPEQQRLNIFFQSLTVMYDQAGSFRKTMQDMLSIPECWSGNAIDGMNVPIGWAEDTTPVYFTVGGVQPHALLAGRSGSGKSNVLHVLIQSLCNIYAPSELSLYLLDYKQGVEFNIYADPPLPHAKLVATESDPEYGITVLEHLHGELNVRAKLFKDAAINSYSEYRQKTKQELPRILLIIDEFQMLFTERTASPGKAEELLSLLLRQGRSYGIHILLATQTLRGISATSMGQLTSQIGCRIALSCQEEDSAMLLSSGNNAAALLKSPPEGIINTENGIKSGNKKFLIPYAEPEFCRKLIAALSKRALEKGYCTKPRIFERAKLPLLPRADWFSARQTPHIQLYVGTQLRFEEPPLAICLEKRPAFNLLIAGNNSLFHDGLLAAILHSLNANCADKIVYVDGRLFETGNKIAENKYPLPVISHRGLAGLDFAALADEVMRIRTIFIIDGLESIKELRESGLPPAKQTDNTPPSPLTSFKKILEDGPSHGSFVIVFTERWKQCNTVCKGLMDFFEMRVGFCLNEDDAGSLNSASHSKLKGLDKSNRAVFIDRLRQQVSWFRPYVLAENKE